MVLIIFMNTIAQPQVKRLRVGISCWSLWKLVSQVVLPHKSIHNNRDIVYDQMVLIFFMNTIAKQI